MSGSSGAEGRVTADEAQAIIDEWARLQDTQAGLAAFLPIVADDGFLLQSPAESRRWEGHAGLEAHQEMKRFFFDEEHDFRDVRIAPGEERTIAWTCLGWEARYRPQGSPTSKVVKAHMEHEWEFRRCGRTGRPYVLRLTVDSFEYRKGCGPETSVAGIPYLDPGLPTRSR